MTFEQLKETHGAEAETVWRTICALGGFGDVPTSYDGGLDLTGLDGDKKKAVDNLLKVKGDK